MILGSDKNYQGGIEVMTPKKLSYNDHNQSSGKILWGSSLKLAVGHFNCWVSFPRWSDPKAIKTALNLNSHTSESSLEVKAGALCISLLDFVKKTPTVLFLPLSLV